MSSFTQLPADYQLFFVAGDYVAIPITIKSGGVAKDLTGYTFDAHVKKSPSNVAFTVEVKNQTLYPGQLILSLSMAQTATLVGRYSWELDWLDISLNRRTLIASSVMVTPNG